MDAPTPMMLKRDRGIPSAVCLRFVGPFMHGDSGHVYENGQFQLKESPEADAPGALPERWVRPSAVQWAEFWRVCRAVGVWSWPAWLGEREDQGLGWHLVLEIGGRRLVSEGRVAGAPPQTLRKLLSLHFELRRLMGLRVHHVQHCLRYAPAHPAVPTNLWPIAVSGPVVPEFLHLRLERYDATGPESIRITDGVVERPRLTAGIHRLRGEQWTRFWQALQKSGLWRFARGRGPRGVLPGWPPIDGFFRWRLVIEAGEQRLAVDGFCVGEADDAGLRSRLGFLHAELATLVEELPAEAAIPDEGTRSARVDSGEDAEVSAGSPHVKVLTFNWHDPRIPTEVHLSFTGPADFGPSDHRYERGQWLLPERRHSGVQAIEPARCVRPLVEEWVEFWRICDEIGVWSWPAWQGRRDDPEGVGWRLVLAVAGRRLESEGRLEGAPPDTLAKLLSLHCEIGAMTGQSPGHTLRQMRYGPVHSSDPRLWPKLHWPWNLEGPVVPDRIWIIQHGVVGVLPIEDPKFEDGVAGRLQGTPWPVRPSPARWAEFWQVLAASGLRQLHNRHRPSHAALGDCFLCPGSHWELGIELGRYRLSQQLETEDAGTSPAGFERVRRELLRMARGDTGTCLQ